MNNNKIASIATKYISAVSKSGIKIHSAYLFGSYAKGRADKNSDIDICIVSSSFSDNRQFERIKLMSITHQLSDAIEPHPLTIKEFDNPYNPFVKEVKKGVQLV